jgi:hypothetical protein
VTLTIEQYRWDGMKADNKKKSKKNMKGHWPEFQCWNQLNRSKNSLKDQQPRKNKAITKIHTLVLKILKKHKKKEKKREYFYGSFWKAFDVIQINSCWATECLIFFSMCDFHKKTKLVIFDITRMSYKLHPYHQN